MPRYVHVSEGPTASEADDLLVIADASLVRAIGQLIARRLGGTGPTSHPTVVPLPTTPDREGER
jgi:hypothetical protein